MTQILLVFADPGLQATQDAIPQWGRAIPDAHVPEWPWGVMRVRYTVTLPIATHPAQVTGIKRADASTIDTIETWDILPKLEGRPLIHICHPYTRAGETAFVAAKLLGKKIVLSDFEPGTSAIGRSLGIAGLADALICRSEEEADGFAGHGSAEVLDLNEGGSWRGLSDIYAQLLGGAEGAR